jgi:hypothetical protein
MSNWSDQSDALLAGCVEAFGMDVSYQRDTLTAFTVTGIFGHPNQEDAVLYGQGVTLDVRTVDFVGTAADPGPQKGDKVTIAGNIYQVYLVNEDSEGASKLFMTKL